MWYSNVGVGVLSVVVGVLSVVVGVGWCRYSVTLADGRISTGSCKYFFFHIFIITLIINYIFC
jgi:hypothetical protein